MYDLDNNNLMLTGRTGGPCLSILSNRLFLNYSVQGRAKSWQGRASNNACLSILSTWVDKLELINKRCWPNPLHSALQVKTCCPIVTTQVPLCWSYLCVRRLRCFLWALGVHIASWPSASWPSSLPMSVKSRHKGLAHARSSTCMRLKCGNLCMLPDTYSKFIKALLSCGQSECKMFADVRRWWLAGWSQAGANRSVLMIKRNCTRHAAEPSK